MFKSRTTRIFLSIAVAMVIASASLWWLSSVPPRWYQPPQTDDDAAEELAALVEHRLAEEVHKIRQDDSPWQLRIREEQVNAWLATRMPKWLEHERGIQWPSQLGTPQVRFVQDSINLAIPAQIALPGDAGDRRLRTVTLTIVPHLDDEEIRFTLTGLRIGRLTAPGDPVNYIARIAGLGSERGERESEAMAAYLTQLAAGELGFAPSVSLVDDRQVTLTAVRIGRGSMDVSVVTNSPVRAAAD